MSQGHAHELTLDLQLDSQESAEKTLKALQPEISDFQTTRTTLALEREKNNLRVKIKAADLTSMRAITNSLLKLITIINSIKDIKQVKE